MGIKTRKIKYEDDFAWRKKEKIKNDYWKRRKWKIAISYIENGLKRRWNKKYLNYSI